MTISNYDLAVAQMRHALGALIRMLDKAETYVAEADVDPADLLEAKLAPDMRDFVFQVQVATDVARRGIARLAGTEAPSWADEEQSLAELRTRVQNALDYFGTFTAERFDGADSRDIALKLRDKTHEMCGADYLQCFIMPNVYFHLSIAYALLRQNGVELGKRDFLGALTLER